MHKLCACARCYRLHSWNSFRLTLLCISTTTTGPSGCFRACVLFSLITLFLIIYRIYDENFVRIKWSDLKLRIILLFFRMNNATEKCHFCIRKGCACVWMQFMSCACTEGEEEKMWKDPVVARPVHPSHFRIFSSSMLLLSGNICLIHIFFFSSTMLLLSLPSLSYMLFRGLL